MCNKINDKVNDTVLGIFEKEETKLQELQQNLVLIKERREKREKRRKIVSRITKIFLTLVCLVGMFSSLMMQNFYLGCLSSILLLYLWLI